MAKKGAATKALSEEQKAAIESERKRREEELERKRNELEAATNSIVESWAEEVTSLGCEVKGLWLVDWDCGDGYYCWKYPEDSIAFFHGYKDGFQGRVPLT